MILACYDRASHKLLLERYNDQGQHLESRVLEGVKMIEFRGISVRLPLNSIDKDRICMVIEKGSVVVRGSVVVFQGEA